MKTQLNPFVKFIKRLPGTWVQQAAALVERIKNLSQKPVAVKNIAFIFIFLATTSLIPGTIMWIYLDGICKNCGDGRESAHLETCDNCKTLVYSCPTVGHEHISGCGHCGGIVYHCDFGDTTKDHSLQTCGYCSNSYIPCIQGNEHGYGVCLRTGITVTY